MFDIDPAEIGFNSAEAVEAAKLPRLQFRLAVDRFLLEGSHAIGKGKPELEDYAYMVMLGSSAQIALASALASSVVSGFGDDEVHGLIANASRMMKLAIDNFQETLAAKIALARTAIEKEASHG